MIKITKVEFTNYRQYRQITIEFPDTDKYHLHVLRAKNGTGKTTLLNGILWCFYGKEHYLSNDDKALPIVNDGLVEESADKEPLDVHVRITVVDDTNSLVFDRKQTFYVMYDAVRNKKNVVTNQSKLTITITDKADSSKNSRVIEDNEESLSLVKQYFDESIFDYYFFDGENLKSYFEKGKSEKIKESIFNISQVTLLKNASSHVETMATEKYRSASKMVTNSVTSLYEEEANLKNTIKGLKDENAEIDKNTPVWQQKVDECDSILHGFAPVRTNQDKRKDFLRQLGDREKELKTLIDDKNAFIRDYLLLLNFFPRIKATYDLIIKKEQEGNLPPNIDKKQIINMLENHAKKCPVCDGDIDEHAIGFLKDLLNKLDVSSETSNYLMSIKSTLEALIEKVHEYPKKKSDIISQEKYLKEEIGRINKELDRISSFLSNWSSDDEVDVSKAENDRKHYQGLISSGGIRKALNEKDINIHKGRLKEIEDEISEYENKKSNKDSLNEQVKVFRRLSSMYDLVKGKIMDEIKEEIQKETWNTFDSMIWKRNTFGSIDIDDNYELVVRNTKGKEMTGSLSATESMALAYAFTLAIHQASGKNCPLVVDSPLGRVSDDNRANMAAELLKVSMEKQIIMLFTPDEYSEDVKKIYDHNACSIRDIVLSDDEKQVEKVGE